MPPKSKQKGQIWWYAMAVFFKNASASRVLVDKYKDQGKSPSWQSAFAGGGCRVWVPAFAAVLGETSGPANSGIS